MDSHPPAADPHADAASVHANGSGNGSGGTGSLKRTAHESVALDGKEGDGASAHVAKMRRTSSSGTATPDADLSADGGAGDLSPASSLDSRRQSLLSESEPLVFGQIRQRILAKGERMAWAGPEVLITLPEHPEIEPCPAWAVVTMMVEGTVRYETLTFFVRKTGSQSEQEKWFGVRFAFRNLEEGDYFLLVHKEGNGRLIVKVCKAQDKQDWNRWCPMRNRRQTLTAADITTELIKFFIKNEMRSQGVRSLAGPRIQKSFNDITRGRLYAPLPPKKPRPAANVHAMPLGSRKASAEIKKVVDKVRGGSRGSSSSDSNGRARPTPPSRPKRTMGQEQVFEELDLIAGDIYSHVAANFARAKSSVRAFCALHSERLAALELQNRKLEEDNAALKERLRALEPAPPASADS